MPAPTQADIQPLVTLFQAGDFARLEPLARDFAQRHPGHGLGWMLLAAICKADRRFAEALRAQERAIAVMPPKAELLSNLGNIQLALGMEAPAEQSYRKALALEPGHANAQLNLGILLLQCDREKEAEPLLFRAMAALPDAPEPAFHAAVSLLRQHRHAQAIALLRRALDLRPGYAEALDSLSYAQLHGGDVEAAIASAQAAVQLEPDDADYLGNLLFALNYAETPPEVQLALARRYGALVAAKAGGQRLTEWPALAGGGPLRVGLVSGDFKNHPVAYFLAEVLRHTDPASVAFVGYMTADFRDATTDLLASRVSQWRSLAGLEDAAAARLIHEDGVQILIDLAGHTGHGRLPVFAYRPAPVQATWLGYFATTGVQEIDFILVDGAGVPPAQAGQFTEAVRYLPHTRLCFAPPPDAPEVAPLPALARGFVTFGCCQSVAKMRPETLRRWAAILARVPGSRLRWQAPQFADPAAQEALAAQLAAAGIARERVDLLAGTGRADYLASYAGVDIALDTFPFPGGTTTCEALWMGVPTVSLVGTTLLSRQGASLLGAAGLADWACDSGEAYVERAVAAASDLEALAGLRARMREQVARSPLFDAPRFARDFQDCLQALWRDRTAGS